MLGVLLDGSGKVCADTGKKDQVAARDDAVEEWRLAGGRRCLLVFAGGRCSRFVYGFLLPDHRRLRLRPLASRGKARGTGCRGGSVL